eukprot:6096232-Amphidinium_carterae.1
MRGVGAVLSNTSFAVSVDDLHVLLHHGSSDQLVAASVASRLTPWGTKSSWCPLFHAQLGSLV